MLVVIYQWSVKPGQEANFEDGWHKVTESLYQRGSLGSRLHRAENGTYLAYAQWPSKETRQKAFDIGSAHPEGEALMAAAIEVSKPPILTYVTDDLLRTVFDKEKN